MVKNDLFRLKYLVILASVMISVISCNQDDTSSEADASNVETNPGSIATPTATSAPASGTPTCVTGVIDYGVKQSSSSTYRGEWSDIELMPTATANGFAVAYNDRMTGGVLVSWSNGSASGHEMAAGDPTATYIQMEFLSTGIPLVFWSTGGTTVKMASRSAPFGQEGFWTGAIMDTLIGGATRNLDAEVNPADEVGVFYMSSNTATTQRPRFLKCDAGCATPGNYMGAANVMATAQSIESPSSVTINQVQTDLEWCGHDSNTDGTVDEYYPAVVYQGAASTNRYAICKQANLNNCLTATNWDKVTFASGISVLSSELNLDPTIDGDFPKIFALNSSTAGLHSYRPETTNHCYQVTPAAFTAAAAKISDSGSTTGNAWISSTKDVDGKWHVLTNLSTTAYRYFNSTSTDPNASWNNGSTVLTSTLLAAGHGGAIIKDGRVLGSFAPNAAPYNLQLGVIADYRTPSSSATPSVIYPNLTGHLQPATSQTRNFSLATTNDGRVGIVFIDNSNAGNGARFIYAFRDGTSPNSSWVSRQISFQGTAPKFPSLAYDHNNHPWISYFDSNGASSRYYVLYNSTTEGSAVWDSLQFPNPVPAGAHTLPAHNDTAMAMYYSGGIAYPVMIAMETNSNQTIRSAMINTSSAPYSFSAPTTIATLGTQDAAFLSSDFDTNGNIVVAWQDLTTSSIEPNYSASNNGGTSWTTSVPITASSGLGQGLTITIDRTTGFPAITYFDRTNNQLYFASCTNTPIQCDSMGSWSNLTVGSGVAISALTSSTTATEGLLNIGLSFNDDGDALIFYPTGMGGTIAGAGNVMNLTSIGADSSITTQSWVKGAPNNCMNTVLHYGVSGWNAQSKITSTGEKVTAYIGPGNWLYHKSCSE